MKCIVVFWKITSTSKIMIFLFFLLFNASSFSLKLVILNSLQGYHILCISIIPPPPFFFLEKSLFKKKIPASIPIKRNVLLQWLVNFCDITLTERIILKISTEMGVVSTIKTYNQRKQQYTFMLPLKSFSFDFCVL